MFEFLGSIVLVAVLIAVLTVAGVVALDEFI